MDTDEEKILLDGEVASTESEASTTKDHTSAADSDGPIQATSELKKYSTKNKLSEPKPNVESNHQKLPIEKPTDPNKFYESLQRIEDRLHSIRDKKLADNKQRLDASIVQDNYQSLGSQKQYKDSVQSLGSKKQFVDNRQKISNSEIPDNYQDVGPADKLTSNYLYKEKKNIQNNLQHVSDTPDSRSSPTFPPVDDAHEASSLIASEKSISEMTEAEARQILAGDLGEFDEDELRAKVRQMREKLSKANRTLIDVEKKNERLKD
jgi:hypothetical protein